MRKFGIIILFVLFVFYCATPVCAKSKKTNYQIVKSLVAKMNKPIKLVNFNTAKSNSIIRHRKNKKYVVVEKVISISNGKGAGWTSEGAYIAYNKKVPKNKFVTSYIIYSTETNYFDDILWVVDNNTYR